MLLQSSRLAPSLFFFLGMLATPVAIAQISYVDVEARGEGAGFADALNNALLEAIAQVNGRTLASEAESKTREVTRQTESGKTYYASSDFQQKIRSATNGTISSYEILKEEAQGDGWYRVNVRAEVARYERATNATRTRIAILPFRTTAAGYDVADSRIGADELTQLLTQDLVTQLVQSRKFTILDREYIEEIAGEQKLISSDRVRPEEMARLGEVLVADLILAGTLRNLQAGRRSLRIELSDKTIHVPYVTASLGLRVIDTATQQAKFADTVRVDLKPSASRNQSPSPSNIAELATMAIAKKASARLLEAIFPVLIVSVDGSTVTLNQGGETMDPGQRFIVFSRGEVLRDPYTGEVLGRQETKIGEITLETINPRFSIARIVEENRPFAEFFQPGQLVCRPRQNDAHGPSASSSDPAGESIDALQSKPKEEKLW
jgi:curli biogenesis system outer membrane secretion channel CsgG